MRRRCLLVPAFSLLFAAGLAAQTPDELNGLALAGDSARLEQALAAAMKAPVSDGLLQRMVAEIRLGQGSYAAAAAAARAALRGVEGPGGGNRPWALLVLAQTEYLSGDTAAAHAALDSAAPYRTRGGQQAVAVRRNLGLDPAFAAWRTLETEHLRVHLPPDTRVADPAAWAAARERALGAMQAFFQAPLGKKIDIFVWRDQEAASLAGMPPLGFAIPSLAVVHTRPEQTAGHEIAHVVAWIAGGRPLNQRRTQLVSDGASVLFDGESRDLVAEARAGVRALAFGPVSLPALWQARTFVRQEVMNPVAALTVQRLIAQGGRERFLRLLADERLESARAIYGELLDGVMASVEKDVNGT